MKNNENTKNEKEFDPKEITIQACKDSIGYLRWALALALVICAYLVFQSKREYKDALEEIRHYRDEAQRSLDKLTQEGQQAISNIKEMKYQAIESIKQQGKEEVEKLRKDSDAYKDTLLDKILNKAKLGEISNDDALKLSEMVKIAYTSDLKEFLKSKNKIPDDLKQSLVNSGIFMIESMGQTSNSLGPGSRTLYKLTSHGEKLYNVANETNKGVGDK